jgi:cell division protein FtsL
MSHFNSSLKLFLSILICSSSAISMIFIKHESRELFIELEGLKQARDELNIQWSELKSQENRWANPVRIEQLASENLEMHKPNIESMRLYKKR